MRTWRRRRRRQLTGEDSNRRPKNYAAGCVTIRLWFVATVLRIPTAWSLLTTNIMPWDDIWDGNLGSFHANDPQKGGYTTPAPALDLTTSVRGDWYFTKSSVTGAPLPDPPPPSGGSHDPPPPPAQANFPLAGPYMMGIVSTWGLRHPWLLSTIVTAIATWLGALSRSHGRRAHRMGGATGPVRC